MRASSMGIGASRCCLVAAVEGPCWWFFGVAVGVGVSIFQNGSTVHYSDRHIRGRKPALCFGPIYCGESSLSTVSYTLLYCSFLQLLSAHS